MSGDMGETATEGHAARWVFGYGSLMWNPGFDFVERARATVHGRRRAFCIYSVHHRGTPERPGLVLGLAQGGAVRGVAYRIAADAWPRVHAYLREREQPTETYVEARLTARLAGGRRIEAVAFLSDTRHPQWAGDLPLDAQARLIAGARGLSGDNSRYLEDLVEHLRAEGVRDRTMERLLDEVRMLEAGAAA